MDIKEMYDAQRKNPHEYVESIPYQGCGHCGFGPGAIFHNSYEIERHQREQEQLST